MTVNHVSGQMPNPPAQTRRERLGLNFDVLATLVFRGWSVGAGGVTLLLLPLLLNSTEQGYYYTFASVLALQIFFELGLNQIIMQFVSHEVAHLRFTEGARLAGEAAHIDRLSSLAHLIRRWYLVAALLFAVLAGVAGIFFFDARGTLPRSEWIWVWAVLVCSTAVNLRLSPSLAVMEGCGQIGQVAKLRLKQSMVGYGLLWLGLVTHFGLWSATAVPAVSAVYTSLWLSRNGNIMAWLRKRPAVTAARLDWWKDVFPLQWRVALSWISGYFIFNLFTPLVFSKWGPVEAGKIGLALAMFSAISTIGMSWVNANAPRIAMHISRNERREVNELFSKVMKRSSIVTTALSSILILIAWILSIMGLPIVERVASVGVMSCLAIVTTLNSVVFSLAVYMRAHKEEPMLAVSVVSAFLTLAALYIGANFNLMTMMALYVCVTALITLPWTVRIFIGYFRRQS